MQLFDCNVAAGLLKLPPKLLPPLPLVAEHADDEFAAGASMMGHLAEYTDVGG